MKNSKISKTGMEDVRPPYLLLCNHNAFLDFMIMTAAIFPRRASYVVAIDGFIGREWLLRNVGGIGIRKFTNSVQLVKNMVHARDNGQIIVLFPEARYSLCGTNAILPDSIGKFIKLLDVPVATLIMHGHHVSNPFWGKKRHMRALRADMQLLFTRDRTRELPAEELSELVRQAFVYDDFKWQRDNGIAIKSRDRAAGLHKVLYQCPDCGTEYRMSSARDEIWCRSCGRKWRMTQLGELVAESGQTRFAHVPDWFEWERENVRGEVACGDYHLEVEARVDSLPNARGFVDIGKAVLRHDMDGFTLTGEYGGVPYSESWKPLTLYSCHIEYDYKRRGRDCVDLNTANDTLYIYPEGQDVSVTKIALATEELHKLALSLRFSRSRAALAGV
jgi:hypothetical protein